MTVTVLVGNTLDVLRSLPERSVQCCVTSPPYYGLRSYLPDGHPDKHLEIGLEPTPDEYVARMVAVFREVRRTLRDDGTLWLNIGDSYAAGGSGGYGPASTLSGYTSEQTKGRQAYASAVSRKPAAGYKPKDLLGIPWMLAFALRADGWYLRSEIIWAKPNPMPESVRDRPTKAHEQVFLLSKAQRYFYDADAIAEPSEYPPGCGHEDRPQGSFAGKSANGINGRNDKAFRAIRETRNARSVWDIATQPFSGAHFATMPPVLAERCIKAGSKPGDAVLDPFGGAGTTGLVADRLGRNATLIELNPQYAAMARERIRADAPLFGSVA